MKIGLALGGGGARGLAHVLALEALDACGIKPAMIAGTSMGAIVGALYAGGWSGRDLHAHLNDLLVGEGDGLRDKVRKKAELVKWLTAVRPTRQGGGFLKADRFLERLIELIDAEQFEDLRIPLRVVATDFHSGEPAVFERGPLLPAILASMSIPGVFVPVEHQGRILVDGGVVNNLPYQLLQNACDAVIAIDVAPARDANRTDAPGVIDATLGMFDTMVDAITQSMLDRAPPDIYVRPRLTGIRVLDFDKVEDVFAQARPSMLALKHVLRGGISRTPVRITE